MNFTKRISTGVFCMQALNIFGAADETKPNIILIMTDQQSYNMISALNNTYASTPNIDRLVNRGISFTNTFCANPVSVPSRFAIFTGKYGGEYLIRENQSASAVQADVLPVLKNSGMGNVFKANGYETVYGGKVHLPFAKGTNKFAQPINYGFDTYFTDDERDLLGTLSADLISKRTSSKPLLMVVSFLNPHDICLESSTNLSLDVAVDPTKPEISATIKAIRAEAAAIDSIDFYTNYAPQLPVNFAKTDGYPAKFKPSLFDNFPEYYWRKYRWIYSRLVSLVDTHIGKVLDAIDKSPMKDNTIIVFTSDHGEMQGAHHATVKNLPFDECQHVPFIIAGKGIVSNQRDSSLLCNGTDILPTLCELAGIPIPSGLPGISVTKRAVGSGMVAQRQYLYLEGDGFSQIIENPTFKYTRFEVSSGPNEMLIDLMKDKGEMINVATKSSTYISKTSALSSILDQKLNVGFSPITLNSKIKIYPNPVIDYLVVESEQTNNLFKLYNVTGMDISNQIQSVDNELYRTTIYFRSLTKGLYILKSGSISGKFCVN